MILSIITVTFNCVDTIERTIRSVVSQITDEIEYIVIDGGSLDGTVDIINKYSDHISYWVSESDHGIYDAMNKGIKAAKGEWIAFINGNDWYLPNSLEKVIDAAKSTDVSILYGYVNAIYNGSKDGYIGIDQPIDYDLIYFGNQYCHQGLFIKRELFDVIGLYDTKYKIYADHEWNIRAHKQGYDPYFLNFEVANYTIGGISSIESENVEVQEIIINHYRDAVFHSTQLEKYRGRADFLYLMKTHPDELKNLLSGKREVIMWGIGNNGKECLSALEKIGIQPIYVVATNTQCEYWNDIKAISSKEFFEKYPEGLNVNGLLIISSDKYEDEIEEDLINHKIDRDTYLKMTDIYKWCYEHNTYI